MQAPHSVHFSLSIFTTSPLVIAPTAQASTQPVQVLLPQQQLEHLPFFQQHFSWSIFIGIYFLLIFFSKIALKTKAMVKNIAPKKQGV
jgi:hypothetical protein